ncbi:hypothetical protein EYC84_009780 [Monilinia fructicola]|uniref:Uncharacterized protein n=1 Tax=Monilinia fructicola TaxID=38448 RepID=A0A5M9JFN8_MONFR|nr:hypothetical protein EYC84_009780 [Monilinia fructicola]
MVLYQYTEKTVFIFPNMRPKKYSCCATTSIIKSTTSYKIKSDAIDLDNKASRLLIKSLSKDLTWPPLQNLLRIERNSQRKHTR